MPLIYEYFGLYFFFYSNDHEPVHIHVTYGEYGCKLIFVYKDGKLVNINVKPIGKKKMLPNNKLIDAKKLATKYEKDIVNKWTDYFARHKSPTVVKITKKI